MAVRYSLVYIIKATGKLSDSLPIGSIMCHSNGEEIVKCGSYLLCDGSMISQEDYPDLYDLLKQQQNPEYIQKDTVFRKLLRSFGFNVHPKFIKNKNFTEGFIRLPDLKGQFVVDTDSIHLERKIIKE